MLTLQRRPRERCRPRILAALLLAAPARAQDPPAPQRIAANVVAGGVDLSGLTAAEATAKLKAELAPKLSASVVVRIAGRRFEFDGAKAKVKLNTSKTVAAALAVTEMPRASAPTLPVSAAIGEPGAISCTMPKYLSASSHRPSRCADCPIR